MQHFLFRSDCTTLLREERSDTTQEREFSMLVDPDPHKGDLIISIDATLHKKQKIFSMLVD